MSGNNRKTDFRDNRASFRGGGVTNGITRPQLSKSDQKALEENARKIIQNFVRSGSTSTVLEPMSREQRKVLHEFAKRNNIDTNSHGKEPNRFMVMALREKPLRRVFHTSTEVIAPAENLLRKVGDLMIENPISLKDVDHFLNEKPTKLFQPKYGGAKTNAAIPPKSNCPEKLRKTKDTLPASKYREKTIKSIEKCAVVIISGGTGCGKTTQVPQFILEEAHRKKQKVRILVTQPRRIAAISIAERVAKERGERIGDTVGYQVRLESKKSESTLLTYCTTGVLLRMLTSDPTASGITHIVIDEIHEREINTDYLLIALRECLKNRRDLKIILMSATIEGNMALFTGYFEKFTMETIKMEAKLFHVEEYHLDQILAMIGYQPPANQNFFTPFSFEPEEWTAEIEQIRFETEQEKMREQQVVAMPLCQEYLPPPYYGHDTTANDYGEWVSGSYTTAEGEVIDANTMEQFMTALQPPTRPMLLQMRPGSPNSVYLEGVRYKLDENQDRENLARHKSHRASLSNCIIEYTLSTPVASEPSPPVLSPSKSGLGKYAAPETAFGFGEKHAYAELIERKFRAEMLSALPNRPIYYHPQIEQQLRNTDFGELRLAEKYALFYGADYATSINLHLVNTVVKYLADSPVFGSILVFLPGYDDIQEMTSLIDKWKGSLTNMKNVLVIPLHSQMHSVDHSDIFKPVPHDTRKIILSTNIAEASITIEDVIFVVDTGKAKEKSYNHESKLNALTVNPISKSNAKQRSGRAGRVTNGYCFRLYSEKEFAAMEETQVAQMKRVAIYDVTLHAKIFAPNNMRIAEFLSLAPEPPLEKDIKQAMEYLEQIGALYSREKSTNMHPFGAPKLEGVDPEITDLGRLMARLPLDPHLSRMLLFGLALKCLTPIVNLVAMLANRDPYLLTTNEIRENQNRMKTLVAQSDFSDHLVLIRLCTEYCSKNQHDQFKYCRDNFLNASTMRMVSGTRRQLVQELLRAKLILIRPDRELMTVLNDRCFNKHADSWPMVQAAVAAGCYPAVGVCPMGTKLNKIQTFNDQPAGIHPSSALKKQVMRLPKSSNSPRFEFLAFQELCLSSNTSLQIKMVTAFPSITALLFTGPVRLSKQVLMEYHVVNDDGEPTDSVEKSAADLFDESSLELDAWYSVKAKKEILTCLLRLRHKFMHFFLHGIGEPTRFGADTLPEEQRVLQVIRDLLESEHDRYEFTKVDMPRFFLKNFEPFKKPVEKQVEKKKEPVTNQKPVEQPRRATPAAPESVGSRPQSNHREPIYPVFIPFPPQLHPNNSFTQPPPPILMGPYNVAQPPPNWSMYSAMSHPMAPRMAGMSGRGGHRPNCDPRPHPHH